MAVQTTALVAVETGFDITATRCLTAYGQGCVGRLKVVKLVLVAVWLSLNSLKNVLAQTVARAQFLTFGVLLLCKLLSLTFNSTLACTISPNHTYHQQTHFTPALNMNYAPVSAAEGFVPLRERDADNGTRFLRSCDCTIAGAFFLQALDNCIGTIWGSFTSCCADLGDCCGNCCEGCMDCCTGNCNL
jgi:hypothetical protein